jgi:hypothetical protein
MSVKMSVACKLLKHRSSILTIQRVYPKRKISLPFPSCLRKKDISFIMNVHFKGTRGSIPTAPNASEVSEKVVSALLAARGKGSPLGVAD